MHLTERFNGKDVYLVGTANQSTMLAQRTQKLIEELRPDTVMVQTNKEWWQSAKLLETCAARLIGCTLQQVILHA